MQVVRGKQIETLFSPEQIAERNGAMAEAIARQPKTDLLVISILKGSFIFAADLIRALHQAGLAPEVEFITLSSYGKGTTSQGVKIIKDIDSDVAGRDVLLIDDILESGRTLRFARDLMFERGARSVELAVLLDKSCKREGELTAEYVGFECPDYFVVGYGMDVAYAFRELPFVGVVRGDAS
ncbi:hypoxanthine phosphoribosyltransferase [Pseudohoeflea coraliihabitans]|uniref:Hypoxanthine phosphoribosyltransferase n=1 Tax=Pseudohoeflea coraliihabitans TaxID=2860393 RepID=A0ABS6WKP2_9HYPH|nr:hypoxanthine phosphoribosyltransferase [Pseudohoeflea sp. DP4N28-3]MBW3096519.1 hypoxanthine phosphoribosyltransferase [Pseudohoeflea sp. DP4N28-3]